MKVVAFPMGSCIMAGEVVTQQTVLHHYCSTKFALNLPHKVLRTNIFNINIKGK